MINFSLSGHTIIEASAGTGKTYTLEELVIRLLLEKSLPLSKILLVTFTEKAARELKERIRKKIVRQLELNPANNLLQTARQEFDKAAIYTIHGFCSRVLKEFPVETGFSSGMELIRNTSVLEDYIRDYFRSRHQNLDKDEYCFFISASKGFESGIKRIIAVSKKITETALVYPDDSQIAAARTFKSDFYNSGGAINRAMKKLAVFSNTTDVISKWFIAEKLDDLKKNTMKVGKVVLAVRVLQRLSKIDDFYTFINCLEKEGDVLEKLSADYIAEQMKKSVSHLSAGEFLEPHYSLFQLVSEVLAAWRVYCDDGELSKPFYSRILAFAFIRDVCHYINEGIGIRKQLLKKYDYDDLITTVHRLVKPGSPFTDRIREKYQVALIDEFQDTDLVQWEIFHSIFDSAGHNLFLVGDPKQSIYGFRGADLEVYFAARSLILQENRHELRDNYRSSAKLIAGLNALSQPMFDYYSKVGSHVIFSPASYPLIEPDHRVFLCKDRPPVEFIVIDPGVDSEKEKINIAEYKASIYSSISARISLLIADKIEPEQIAILTEKNKECEEVQKVLLDHNIPCLIVRHPELFKGEEARDMLWLLEAVCCWNDRGKIAQALLTPFFDMSYSQIVALIKSSDLVKIQEVFRDFKQLIDAGRIIVAFDKIMNYSQPGFQERYLAMRNGERKVTNTKQIIERLHLEQRRSRLDAMGTYDLLIALRDGDNKDEDLMRLDRDHKSVQIMSMHTSKGLEFPIVFIAGGFSQGIKDINLYEYYDGPRRVSDFLANKKNKAPHDKAVWEERKRLLYVAMTRAQSRLYLPFLARPTQSAIMDYFYLSLFGEALRENNNLPGHPLELLLSRDETSPIKTVLTKEILLQCLLAFCSDAPELFCISALEQPVISEPSEKHETPPPLTFEPLRTTSGFASRRLHIASFTSLSSTYEHSSSSPELIKDNDEVSAQDQEPMTSDPEHRLPGGAAVGEMIHELLENMDFQIFLAYKTTLLCLNDHLLMNKISKIILKHFDRNWCETNKTKVVELLWNTLNMPVLLPGTQAPKYLRIGELTPNVRKHELEFVFPVSRTMEGLIINETIKLKALRKGYLKGFIDLVFMHDNKYYILDWKTNYLGPQLSDYNQQTIKEKMTDHQYYGQYYIYMAAVYLYLKTIIPDFDYERDFGGCYYLFLRGMSVDKAGEQPGVFFDRPSEDDLIKFGGQFLSI